MKKNTLYFLTLMFSVCLLLFACRKEIEYFVNDRVEAPSTQLENAKIWRMRHLKKDSRSEALKPFWDNSWIIKSSNGTLIVVPAPEKKVDNKQFSVRRFFIFSLSGNMISDGRIVELTGDSYDVEKNVDHLLKNIGRSTIHNFNGAVITYDINYSFLESKTYQNGNSNATETRLINSAVGDFNKREPKVYSRSSSCDAVSPTFIGFPASLCANGWVTFLKHTVTDADGCLISETYTFVNISCPSTGGGGSSGGSGSGGSGGNPPYGEGGWTPGGGGPTTIFVNFPGYPCATSVAQQIPNLKARLATTINNMFGKNDNINLHFDIRPTLAGTTTDGELYQSSPMTDYHVGINPDVLAKSSKEYMVATFFHESLHAYLKNKSETLTPAQFNSQFAGWQVNGGRALLVQDPEHWTMGYTDFILGIREAILAFNPNYNPDKALALAEGGILLLTPAKKIINQQERDTTVPGFTGTKCP